MSLSRPVLIKVRTLSICFIIVELTSTDSTDPRDEEARGETRRGRGEQMSVKVMGEKLADTRSKVSLASSDRLRAVEEIDESHLRQWLADRNSILGCVEPRREALIFCYAACNWANHLPLSDRRNVRELFTCIASLNRVENVKSWCVRGSRRNADSPLRGGEKGRKGWRMTTRRGLSLDVIDVAGHEVGMERTVLRTRTTSALVIGRPRPLQILGYRRISPGFWWLSNASALAFEHRERSGRDRRQ
ncbi:hypothetical protein ALC62_15118 [Cyphomyrmex costatus]|uniref:Uncharacterized protein n=1 Tax=Cyphomyrmex costatus TaxID=456900 RepID=A0A151I8F7_9HYME|nr:hypothetical protein ALC62_15118 [Cyphomyrmex costatus]